MESIPVLSSMTVESTPELEDPKHPGSMSPSHLSGNDENESESENENDHTEGGQAVLRSSSGPRTQNDTLKTLSVQELEA